MSSFIQKGDKLIGIEVASTSLKGVCLNEKLQISDYFTVELKKEEEIIPQIIDFIKELKTRIGDFSKIGLAVSGLINRQTKRVVLSARNPEHVEIDLAGEIKKVCDIEIVLENDANSAAFGEFVLGSGRESRDMFFAMIGEGVGGAIILDGKLWCGGSGFAGEFGHIVIDSEGTKLEDVASESGIIKRVKRRLLQDHTSSLGSLSEITVAEIVKEAQKGDDFAEMMLRRTGHFVGIAVASVINLLNIERIVFGGQAMQAENMILDSIVQSAKELSFEPCFANTEILIGELGEKSSAVGVALLADMN